MTRPAQPYDTEMRYLYHLTEGNRGPVTFEQLQELAKAGTIDNMTPVLAEGAREWSRWLFIKDAPPAPAPTPAPAPAPAAKPAPAPQKKEAPKPEPKPAPAPKPPAKTETPTPKKEEAAPKPASSPEPTPKPTPTPAPAPVDPLPAEQPGTEAPAAPSKPFSLRDFLAELNLMQLIPAGVCAVITLLSLLLAGIWSFMAHDTHEEYAKLRDMQAEHAQGRADLEALAAQQQQVIAENTKLQTDIAALQHTLQLTKEESERLAKGPYISEAEAKQLKDEQAKAARLKEQEQKL